MTVEPLRAAGWYDDETDATSLRYWDGHRWTPHTASKPHDPHGTVACSGMVVRPGAAESAKSAKRSAVP